MSCQPASGTSSGAQRGEKRGFTYLASLLHLKLKWMNLTTHSPHSGLYFSRTDVCLLVISNFWEKIIKGSYL